VHVNSSSPPHRPGDLLWSSGKLLLVSRANGTIPIGFPSAYALSARSNQAQKEDLLGHQLDCAVQKRPWPRGDLQRLVFGALDGFPGLIVDQYGSVLRIETNEKGYLPWISFFGQRIQKRVPSIAGWVEVFRPGGGQKARLREHQDDLPKAHIVHEQGMRFLVKTRSTQAVGTGIFFDQRIGRRWVQANSRGKNILNLFAHAGAFGVAALCGGARRVDHVDQARKCAPWAACNLALNGGNPKEHRFIVDDAFAFLRRVIKRPPQYGGIICDPPTTAFRKKGGRFVARDHLSDLSTQCCRVLLPGGFLFLCCNHRQLSWHVLEKAVQEGAQVARRSILHLRQLEFEADFPLGAGADSAPTKGIWIELK
jgi:23S rRNA (cytosine1962-C5)-methyltransferase